MGRRGAGGGPITCRLTRRPRPRLAGLRMVRRSRLASHMRALALCGATALAALVLGLSPDGGRARDARPAAGAQALDVVGLTARIGRDTVHTGGVVLDAPSGLVLTTAHGIWGATSLKVTTGLTVLHGAAVARAPCQDLALVVTQPRLPGLTTAPNAGGAVAPSRGVAVLRQADGTVLRRRVGLRLAGGVVPTAVGVPASGEPLVLRTSLPSSWDGAPIMDVVGRMVGMVRGARAGRPRTVVQPWPAVRRTLASLRPGTHGLYGGWRSEYRCARALHIHAAATYPGYRAADARLNAPVPATRLPGTQNLDTP